MKNKSNKTIVIYSAIVNLLFFLNSTNAFSHFGSKGPFGGSVQCGIAQGTVVYLGTTNGGVYESSTLTLSSWRARPVGLKSGKITALAHTGSYLVAGTEDSGVFIFNGYVGADRYWNKINNGLTSLRIKSLIAIDTISFLVGTDGGGVYKTTNKGVSWTQTSFTSFNNAVVTGFAKSASRYFATTSTGGVFYSTNDGATWADFNDANTLSISGTTSLCYNPTSDELLVSNGNGLFVAGSVNSTTSPSYTSVQTGLPSTTVYSLSCTSTNWYLATSTGVYTSTTGTVSWVASSSGLSGAALDIRTVVPNQTYLIAGSKTEGIFKSNQSSIAWSANNTNFNNLVTYSLACYDTLLVVAATERGVFVSKDLAANYSRSNKGLTDSLHVSDIVFSGTNLFAATQNSGVFSSTDSGKVWIPYNIGLPILSIKKLFVSNAHLYCIATNGNVYQSTGLGWVSIQNGLPSGVNPTSIISYNAILYIGTMGDGVYSRPEESGTWSAVNSGLSNLNVTSMTTNGNRLFAGTDGNGVFVSPTTAINWSSTAPLSISHTTMLGLDGTKVQSMNYYKGYVFAGYKGGLLASSDNGQTWIAGGNQFNLPSFTDVNKISFLTSRVFVSTENNALYSNGLSELPTIVISGILDKDNFLESSSVTVYPNPSNGIFSIDYSDLIKNQVEEVKITNAHGALLNQYSSAVGSIEVEYPKGIYYLQVKTKKGSTVKKISIE